MGAGAGGDGRVAVATPCACDAAVTENVGGVVVTTRCGCAVVVTDVGGVIVGAVGGGAVTCAPEAMAPTSNLPASRE